MNPFRLSDNFIRLASFHARGLPIDLANVKSEPHRKSAALPDRLDGMVSTKLLQTTPTPCILSAIREAGYSGVKTTNLGRLRNGLSIHPVDL